MNLKKARIKAQLSADDSGLDYAIIGSGNSYDCVIAKRHKGKVVETISPSIPEISKKPKRVKVYAEATE